MPRPLRINESTLKPKATYAGHLHLHLHLAAIKKRLQRQDEGAEISMGDDQVGT